MMTASILKVYALCLFSLTINLQQAASKTKLSLTLGFIGPTNISDINAISHGQMSLFAFKLAIRDINNRHSLLPNTTLHMVWNDSGSDIGQSVIAATWQCSNAKVIGIVGEQNSVFSEVKHLKNSCERNRNSF